MLDGYAPPEDAELVLESLGPRMVRRYAEALRAAEAGTLDESLILRLDKAKSGSVVWSVSSEATQRVIVPKREKLA
jgi:hypothetical protein